MKNIIFTLSSVELNKIVKLLENIFIFDSDRQFGTPAIQQQVFAALRSATSGGPRLEARARALAFKFFKFRGHKARRFRTVSARSPTINHHKGHCLRGSRVIFSRADTVVPRRKDFSFFWFVCSAACVCCDLSLRGESRAL